MIKLSCEQEAALRDAIDKARAGGEYELADKIREALRVEGYEVKNTSRGTKLRKKLTHFDGDQWEEKYGNKTA